MRNISKLIPNACGQCTERTKTQIICNISILCVNTLHQICQHK